MVNESWNSYRYNISAGSTLSQAQSAETPIASIPGVAHVQPQLRNSVKLGGQDGYVWALPDRPIYSFHLISGRLLTPADTRARSRVVVVEQSMARASNTHLGCREAGAPGRTPTRSRTEGPCGPSRTDDRERTPSGL